MGEDDKKVLKFSVRNVQKSDFDKKKKVKSFAGFEYVKMEKDLNGTPFIKESLLEYATNCKYVVRVMRQFSGKVSLYNYYIPQEKLSDFLAKINNGEFDGTIIEVEKYIPEDLA